MTSASLRDGNLNSIGYFDRKRLLIAVYGKPAVHNLFFKGEGHSKKPDVLSLPIARKHSTFPLTEVSASYVSAILKKFVSKKAQIKFDFG